MVEKRDIRIIRRALLSGERPITAEDLEAIINDYPDPEAAKQKVLEETPVEPLMLFFPNFPRR